MAEINVPLRPREWDRSINREDKYTADVLTYYVLHRVTKYEALVLYYPEFQSGEGVSKAGREVADQMFKYAKCREYIDAYRETLEGYLAEAGGQSTAADIDEGRKDRALKILLDQAMQVVESGAQLDPDTLKTIAELFKRLGLLKEEVEEQEKPRRYLPERCGDCEYKKFIDEQVRLGNIKEE